MKKGVGAVDGGGGWSRINKEGGQDPLEVVVVVVVEVVMVCFLKQRRGKDGRMQKAKWCGGDHGVRWRGVREGNKPLNSRVFADEKS